MSSIEFLKPNYDDFYKFLVSGGILLLLVGAIMATFDIVYAPSDTILKGVSFACYFSLAVVGAIASGLGIREWYKNQKILDKKLRDEERLTNMEVKLRELTLEKTKKDLEDVISGKKKESKFVNSFISKAYPDEDNDLLYSLLEKGFRLKFTSPSKSKTQLLDKKGNVIWEEKQ